MALKKIKTTSIKRKYRSYKEARLFVNKLRLRSSTEWRQYCNGEMKSLPALPKDIPLNPYNFYKNDDWINWRDFIGPESGKIPRASKLQRMEYRSYDEAEMFAVKLHLKSSGEWYDYCTGRIKKNGLPKKPDDIPYSVKDVYRENWKGWKVFLGKEKV